MLTTTYLQDTAAQAGLRTAYLRIDEIGWDGRRFVGTRDEPILSCFKLYPWEWLLKDAFGAHVAAAGTRFIEPAWKMIVSNKAFLAILHERNPGHPNLLRAAVDAPPRGVTAFARKPILGREGANVTLVKDGEAIAQGPDAAYGAEGFVYQELFEWGDAFGGRAPVLGSWIVRGEAAGMGIRESDGPITTDAARFVPHVFTPRGRAA